MGVQNRREEAACADPASLSRIASRTAEIALPKKKTLSTGAVRWRWDHPPGDQYPTLGPEDWLQPNVVASAQKVIFHVGILHEFSVVAR